MKKTLLILSLLLVTLPLAVAQELHYALPATTVTVKVEIEQEQFFAGPYASFAHTLLNMDVREDDAVTSTLLKAELLPRTEADPEAWYTTEGENRELLALCPQGLVSFRDPSEGQRQHWNFAPRGEKDFSRSGLTGSDKEVTRIEYRTIQTDTAEVSIPVEHKVLVKKSLEDKAADAAEMILSIRQDRLNIASGNTDASYSGEAMGAALAELERTEKEYLSLFRGYSVKSRYSLSFDVTPSPSERVQRYLVFRLADGGVVTDGSSKGVPYYLELEPERQPSLESAGRKVKGSPVRCRIPVVCKVRLTEDGHTLLQTRIPVYQLGKEIIINSGK